MPEHKTPTLTEQASYLFYGKGFAFALTFAIPLILVRIFTEEQWGLYGQILLVSFTIDPFLRLGMSNSLFFFFPQAETRERQRQLLSQTVTFLVSVGLVFLPLFVIFRGPISAYFQKDGFIDFIVPIGLFIVLFMVSDLVEYIFILENKAKPLFTYLVINQITRQGLVLAAALIFRDVRKVAWALVVFAGLRSLYLFIHLRRVYGIRSPIEDVIYFRSQLKYALPLGLGANVGNIGRYFDKLIIANMFSAASYGIYDIGSRGIPLINLLFISVGNVVLPRIAKHRKEGRHDLARELWHKMVVKFATVTIPLVTYFAAAAGQFVPFMFTDAYLPSVNIYRIFLLIVLGQIFHHGTIPRMYDRTRAIFLANLASTVIGISGGYILVKNFGLIGGAVSAALAFNLNNVIQLVLAKNILSLSFKAWLPWKQLGKVLAISGLLAPTLYLTLNLDLARFWRLAVSATLYLVPAGLLLDRFGFLNLKSLIRFVLREFLFIKRRPS